MKKGIIFYLVLMIAGASSLFAAKTKVNKLSAEDVLQKGRDAFYNYDFEEAADFYDQYRTMKSKAKQSFDEEFEQWETELEIATNAFDRVQKIIIIDSILVPYNKFISSYKLSKSSGKLMPNNRLDPNSSRNEDIGFISEDEDLIIMPIENKEGDLRLYEKRRLLDGTWDTKESLEGDFEKNGDYAYPFMGGDGQTLYFANNGEESMGGFDIFVAQRDPLTGEYRQPLNLGMPFNSPYDDFMMAVDEENRIGWWATTRNSWEGKVIIYIYIIDEVRKNYQSDVEDLVNYAKIISFKDTWPEGFDPKDYTKKLISTRE